MMSKSGKFEIFEKAERAVIAVVAYSAQFDHPLTVGEISARLLTAEALRVVEPKFGGSGRGRGRGRASRLGRGSQVGQVSERGVGELVAKLVRRKVFIQKGDWITVFGREKAFEKRRLAGKAMAKKEALVEELVALVRRCPWVLGLALTGSYAAGGAVEKDDIDFLVVTQKNRLWLARLWLLFYSWRRGRRPHIPGDISQSWDFNFWLDETRLRLPPQKRTVYEAYELLQTRWVFERDGLSDTLWKQNAWVKRFLVRPPRLRKFVRPARLARSVLTVALSVILATVADVANVFAFLAQVGYRTLRHGRQKADAHSAFFHPSHTRDFLFLAWKTAYQRALGRKVVLATGVFDVLHSEHEKFLRAAKKEGDFLVVGLESDARVRRAKGPGRPVHPLRERIERLRRLGIVDEVFALPEPFRAPDRQRFIRQVLPHVLAVSSHSPHLEDKRRVLRSVGGRVAVVLPHNPAVSTTQILRGVHSSKE